MNAKNIQKALKAKLDNWCKNIDNEDIVKVIKNNAIITGGAIVSLLNGEAPNDYDVYFKTYDSCLEIVKYYVEKWNTEKDTKIYIISDTELYDFCHSNKLFSEDWAWKIYGGGEGENREKYNQQRLDEISPEQLKKYYELTNTAILREKRISVFIRSQGIAAEPEESGIDDGSELQNIAPQETEPLASENQENPTEPNPEISKPKYRPRYFSTNAISLSDGVQLVIRFYGDVDTIHKNYDFVHCTCSYDYKTNAVNLPARALEAIINKELYYVGSKYPLCSIIRTRKFISRGWTINAGQYLKMALQLNELNLKDLNVFKDQLAGVDSAYFSQAISMIAERKEKDPTFEIDNSYLFEVINRIF